MTNPGDVEVKGRKAEIATQPPKSIRPKASPRRSACFGFLALRNRSASSKNSFCSRLSVAMAVLMSFTNIALAVTPRAFAKLRTCAATVAGKLML